ncbi:MAG: hypothetical protein GYB53_17985 [Rhodobacteraceae bacterium]|nr:hypothetical protein [Paracoccaceae bacterium]MBR9821057.1 hypothetical protein [Paracoccaceae bacterium]
MLSRLLLPILLACLALPVTPARAQQVTPNHVYQVTEEIWLDLERMHQANFSQPGTAPRETAARRPRHVLQKAREVSRKLQMLRFVNGLDTDLLPPMEVREATPGDVFELVVKLRDELADLHGAYGLSGPVGEVALPTGKSPTDVYNRLLQIEVSLDGLGLPPVVPNDVYRLAETLRGELLLLSGRPAGSQPDPAEMMALVQKTPGDAYSEANALLTDLRALGDSGRFAVPGGIVLPDDRPIPIRPGDVLHAISVILAEVSAMKAVVDLRDPMQRAPFQGGMTPNEVWNSLSLSRELVAGLAGAKG